MSHFQLFLKAGSKLAQLCTKFKVNWVLFLRPNILVSRYWYYAANHCTKIINRSSPLEAFLGKGVLKICSKFTKENPCRIGISIDLFCNFIEIALRYGGSPVNLLQFSEHLFLKTTLEGWFRNNFFKYFKEVYGY